MIEWKDIKNFEGRYSISNTGIVKNIKRNTELKSYNNKAGKGYLYVDLYKGKNRVRRISIHRLVAEHFLDNVDNKNQVNHIDGNTLNNNYKNLEWVTPTENMIHSINVLKNINPYIISNKKRQRAVLQIDFKTGMILNRFESINEAGRITGVKTPNIINICKGKGKQIKGFSWQYVKE